MADRVLNVRITGDASKLTHSMQQAGKATESLGAKTGPLRSRLGGLHESVKAVAIGFVGFEAVKKGAEFLIDATKAAEEDQAQLAILANQANNAGVSWKQNGEEIEKTITSMSNASGFMKSDLINSFGRLVTATHSAEKSTHLLADAENVARARHVDLQTATQILIRANMGNVGALRRLGIEIPGITSKMTAQQKAVLALATIHKAYAGASAAYTKTAAGAIDVLRVRWENLKIEIGNRVLPILGKAAVAIGNNLPAAINRASPALSRLRSEFARDLPAIQRQNQQTTTAISHFWARWGSDIQAITHVAVTGVLFEVKNRLKGAEAGVSFVANVMTGRWGAAWGNMKTIVRSSIATITGDIRSEGRLAIAAASWLGNGIYNAVAGPLHSLESAANSVFSAITSAAHAAASAVGAAGGSGSSGNNPKYAPPGRPGHAATGGIVMSERMVDVAEGGPEAIIPLAGIHRPAGWGGKGDVYVTVNVGGVAGVTATQLAEEVRKQLVARQRRNGSAIAPGIA